MHSIATPRALTAVLLLLLAAAPLAAQPQALVDQFARGQHTLEGLTLPYRLFVPDGYDSTRAYPLVVAFHGSGERGTDNQRHIAVHRLATAWADPAAQARHPAFVVAPQLPPNLRWTMDAPMAQSSFTLAQRVVLDLLDSLQVRYAVDPDRIYAVGLSLGGHATWDFVSRRPDYFAAAVPMSGRTFGEQAGALAEMPLWIFHGESDTVVPASGSRSMVYELEKRGRDVVYTDCRASLPTATNYDCPTPLPSDSVRRAIAAGADLFYTGVRFGGHGPWAPWFDNAIMQDWLFRQHRRDPGALALGSPTAGAVWSGTQPLTWTTTRPATDTVAVYFSRDAGDTWTLVARVPNTGTYPFDTTPFADSPLARVRLDAIGADGFVYGRATSGPFYLDHAGDGAPVARLDTFALRFEPRLVVDTLTLGLVAADPERAPLTADLFWSVDGTTFTRFGTRTLASSQEAQPLGIDLGALPNTPTARLRVDVSDGAQTATATSPLFAKQTPRVVGAASAITQVAGRGRGTVRLHIVDRDALTGSTYRVVLDSRDPFAKTYAVDRYDAYTGETPPPPTRVLDGVPLSDGVRESPLFDGLRLVVEDAETGLADLDNTGWVEGDSDLGVTVTGGRVRIKILNVTLLDTDDTYTFTMTDAVADTSVNLYAFPEKPMRFAITAASDGGRRKAVFDDKNNDGRPGHGDVLYLLERNRDGVLAPAWAFSFSATAATVLPETDNVFRFTPLPKLGTGDVFEFIGSTETRAAPVEAAGAFGFTAAPTPFRDRVRVAFTLPAPGRVTLDAYDLLGRRVARLAGGDYAAGPHETAWSGAGLAAGAYVLRLTVEASGARHTAHRMVLRVE